MFGLISILVLVTIMVIPAVCYVVCGIRGKKLRTVLGVNIGLYFVSLAFLSVLLISRSVEAAEAAAATSSNAAWGFMAAALATGFSTIGAGIAVASSSSAAIGAISENPKILGKTLIFVALGEGIALYGLLVTFTILGKI